MDSTSHLQNESIPDHLGASYRAVLANVHEWLSPENYLEIGTEAGHTLALARCRSLSIDPKYKVADFDVVKTFFERPICGLYQMGSDDFFREFRASQILGNPIDLAFLDGMHLCEFLLRDFINVERDCHVRTIVALHDCFPLEAGMAERKFGAPSENPSRVGWWTGDVWRTALLLKRRRPDLKLVSLDAKPTGLLLITGCDPGNTLLADSYDDCVSEMMSWKLESLGIAEYMREMAIQSTEAVASGAGMRSTLWGRDH